ncbi:isopenicillin N synthase family dioxygenase [Paraburkholderia sp. D1E]|uniref:isopenicillin N synthase family dioxygenase n=1 Tax=Paraburkholderia sp. D1E TaxID=3461398 RepID=UPI0040456262
MIPYTPPKAVSTLPIVDLALLDSDDPCDRNALAEQVRRACLDTGFFYVRQHGVANDIIERQYALSRTFFDLDLEAKLRVAQHRSPAKRGYEPQSAQTLDNGSPPDLKESFRFGRDPEAGNPYSARDLPTYGASQWPAESPGLGEAMLPYYDAMIATGDRILRAIALSLEQAESYFKPFYRNPMATVRLLKYPPNPRHAELNQIGAGAHTDWGGITILSQDSVGGLEVQNVAGDWIHAPPVDDAFIVNIGDLMARWTNGRYRSTLHRVKNSAQHKDRYSIAFFYDPAYDSLIDCIASCQHDAQDRQFPACNAGEHIAEMHRRTSTRA